MENTERRRFAGVAAVKAARVRRAASYRLNDAVCVFDLATNLNADVWFVPISTLEGMYAHEKGAPRIFISSLRPPGRQAFTCAHELGHHLFGHGMSLEELRGTKIGGRGQEPTEYQADVFASMLLMPKTAVEYGFNIRNWDVEEAAPDQFYTVASWLGVGYTTLVHHCCYTLSLLSSHGREELLRVRPKIIRAQLSGEIASENLVVADQFWRGRPIDLHVGDALRVPANVESSGNCTIEIQAGKSHKVLKANRPGISRLESSESDWTCFVRVARKQFHGRSSYRFLEGAPNEE